MSKPPKPNKLGVAPIINEADYRDRSPRTIRFVLALICFIAGASVMVIEITAFRLLAPLFGNTAYTWTALIGVILIAFSGGGFLGGWLADRKLAMDLLGWLLASAAVLTFFIPALHELFGTSLSDQGLIAGPVIISLLLFAVPGVLLGAVSPACVRFFSLADKDSHVGAAAGTISMLGSLGSFVGTFLSGFVLLSNFGVKSIFLGTAIILLVLATSAFFLARNTWQQQLPVWLSGLFAAWFGFTADDAPGPNVVWRHDSFYHRIEVRELDMGSGKELHLNLDNTTEGAIRASDGATVLPYQKYWRLATLRPVTSLKSALFLGAGAFGMPCEVSRAFPDAAVDVVEIDPMVIEAGRRFFKLAEHPNVAAHAADARSYLRTTEKKWDLIFGDAYNGVRAIPPHLATREFFQVVSDHLTPDGVFLMNIITAVEGPKSELLSRMLATVRGVFPHVEIFAVNGRIPQAQNVILLASRDTDWSPLVATDRAYVHGSIEEQFSRSHLSPSQLSAEMEAFTDDFNPIDAVIARALVE